MLIKATIFGKDAKLWARITNFNLDASEYEKIINFLEQPQKDEIKQLDIDGTIYEINNYISGTSAELK